MAAEAREETAAGAVNPTRSRVAALRRLGLLAVRRLSWGIADQGMSSLTNFAVGIYCARSLPAAQYGAFSLAYVTYASILNASRGLGTDPLLVRFSAAEISVWRRAVASCTGTSTAIGVLAGIVVVAVGLVMNGPPRLAFIALGLTLPGLMLQDSWRFSFFALGRGYLAFVNDTVWAIFLIPSLILLHKTGHASVFWFIIAWGASGAMGASIGPLQSRVVPKLSNALTWVRQHRDLGPRYLLEGTASSGAGQLRSYGVGLLLGLAPLGYVQAVSTLMGPFTVIAFGIGLVALPEAARLWRQSPHRLPLFCLALSAGLSILALAWGAFLLVALPHGLGQALLGHLWRPTYKLIVPAALVTTGTMVTSGPGTGMHALGAARSSLRSMVITSGIALVGALAGAALGGAVGTMDGSAVGTWTGVFIYWWIWRRAFREADGNAAASGRQSGRHRRARGYDAKDSLMSSEGSSS
jgi:O-antigen/teichoic acid export membrane protein